MLQYPPVRVETGGRLGQARIQHQKAKVKTGEGLYQAESKQLCKICGKGQDWLGNKGKPPGWAVVPTDECKGQSRSCCLVWA